MAFHGYSKGVGIGTRIINYCSVFVCSMADDTVHNIAFIRFSACRFVN